MRRYLILHLFLPYVAYSTRCYCHPSLNTYFLLFFPFLSYPILHFFFHQFSLSILLIFPLKHGHSLVSVRHALQCFYLATGNWTFDSIAAATRASEQLPQYFYTISLSIHSPVPLFIFYFFLFFSP